MSATDAPTLAPALPAMIGRRDHPGRAIPPPARPGWQIPDKLQDLRPGEMLALLQARGDDTSKACAKCLAESLGAADETDEDRLSILMRGYALRRGDRPLQLTMRGRYASELLVRSIAIAAGIHIVTTGRQHGVTFARCVCGWFAESTLNGREVAAALNRRIDAHLVSTIDIDAQETMP